ncbi:MAG: transposase, partial [Planctomycetes bacterium]|nr:transposase [Planctomycetota bacterium]
LLLQALYTIRSETQLVERIDTDLLFRWFLDLDPADTVFDATAYAHNRPRLDEHRIIEAFFDAVVDQALAAGLCSDHFSVDGTIIESYASTKSFQPKEKLPQSGSDQDESGHGESLINRSDDNKPRHGESEPAAKSASTVGSDSNSFKPRNPEVDFHGQKRSNETHSSRTDPPFAI